MDNLARDYHIHSMYSDGEGDFKRLMKACKQNGCMDIAFADHVNESGEFMYGGGIRDENSLHAYIEEIKNTKITACKRYGMKVHVAVEISSFTRAYRTRFTKMILPWIDGIDFILVDGWYINDPVKCAVITREIFVEMGIECFPISIAHPKFGKFNVEELRNILKSDIMLELNEAKFSPRDRQDLGRLLQLSKDLEGKMPKLTMGSDAHLIQDAGNVTIVLGFIRENQLKNLLFTLPG